MGRSHKPRKRYIPKRVDLDPMGLAHALACLLTLPQRRELTEPMRRSFARLRAGQGDAGCWCNLADALNVAERLAALAIANDHADELQAGQQALADLHLRHTTRGGWVMRGTEIAALEQAMDVHSAQLQVCTQGELAEAISTVQRTMAQALAGNASPSALVCVGLLGKPGVELHDSVRSLEPAHV